SPGRASATNTVLPPSRRATPRPSWLRSMMSSSNGVWSIRATSVGAGCGGAIVADAPDRSPRAPTDRGVAALLLLPRPALLVPPAGARAGDPLAREHLADLRLPLRMAVGHRDLAVDRVAVAVVVGHRRIDRHPVLDRQDRKE